MNIIKKNIIQLIFLLLSFIFLFGQTVLKLANDWMLNDNYSHGILVPFITVYMIWQKKDELKKLPKKTNYNGLIVLFFGLLLFFIGNIGAELFITRTAIIITVAGICLLYLGWRVTAVIAMPLVYLMLMIPLPAVIWNKIAFPMQLFATELTTAIVHKIGIPLLREGNILYLPNMTFEVVDACSGLRSLTSLIALSGAFAYISKLNTINKWILFFTAIPIAIILNIFRLVSTTLMAEYISPRMAEGFLHDFSGYIVFIFALILIYALYSILNMFEHISNR